MKKILSLALVLCLALLTACGGDATEPKQEETPETAVTFTDDLGREVTVDRPQRVACLIGSFADIWYLAGGVESIVATANDTWTYFDLPLKEDVVNLGATKELSLEQLLACEPDLVLASCNTDSQVELEPALTDMGLTVAYFDVTNFEDYLGMLAICTEITGCPENYETYGVDIQAQVEEAMARADGSQPSVLYIRASGSSCKVKGSEGSVLGEMLADLDTVNIADRENSLLEELSLEVILQEDPDYIFVVYQSSDPAVAQGVMETTLLSNPAWATLTAIREGNYFVLPKDLFHYKPNARWAQAYSYLADILAGQN